MPDPKHPHHGHKPHDPKPEEPVVTPLDVDEPLPGDGESGGGGHTDPDKPKKP